MQKHPNKDEWVAMFREIGLDDEKMMAWHKLFESRHPEGHQSFLTWLGLPAKEIQEVRTKCR